MSFPFLFISEWRAAREHAGNRKQGTISLVIHVGRIVAKKEVKQSESRVEGGAKSRSRVELAHTFKCSCIHTSERLACTFTYVHTYVPAFVHVTPHMHSLLNFTKFIFIWEEDCFHLTRKYFASKFMKTCCCPMLGVH